MSTGYEKRYKDCDPQKTIGRIRAILKDLGIVTRENWGACIEGCYSLNLKVDGTGIFSNGKGTTPAYALASAYGEMVERLQNLQFVASHKGMGKKAIMYRGFCFAPDEKLLSVDELLDGDEEWIDAFSENGSREKKKDTLEKWQSIINYKNQDGILSLPYYNITKGNLSYIPEIMAACRYGTNGMCAGNTDSEALVQGLSEIIERYVMRKMILQRITPPTIPESYIEENYPFLHNLIQRLEGKGDFRVIVKDCSLGEGYPALAVIFIDRKSHSYNVRFGAHPTFEIALERCLTELLQGNSISNLNWLRSFSFTNKDVDSPSNMSSIVTYGIGHYPVEFFEEASSYNFGEFKAIKSRSNESMLSYLVDILHANGFNIFVRDVSFLGFPSFHIIVPFFSEIRDMDLEAVLRFSGGKNISEILMQLGTASNDELQRVIDYMQYAGYDSSNSIVDLLHKSLGVSFPWKDIKKDLFISSAYYRMGKFKEAYEAMDCFLQAMHSRYSKANNMYFCCVRDYYGILARGIHNDIELRNILVKFYPENILDKVLSILRNPGEVFKNCSALGCFNCDSCQYIKHCLYPVTEKLYMRLKEKYSANPVNQERIAQVINDSLIGSSLSAY